MRRLIVGMLVSGLLLVGCGDDNGDDDDDDILTDAGTVDSGAVDAGDGVTDGSTNGTPASFNFPLTTTEEVPTCAMAGAGATGTATVMVNAANTTIEVDVTYSNLSGAATAAHIHSGAEGVAGPAVLDFGTSLTSPIDLTFTAADYPSSPPGGAPDDFDDFVQALRAGDTYINIHTADCPSGEIRGQIE